MADKQRVDRVWLLWQNRDTPTGRPTLELSVTGRAVDGETGDTVHPINIPMRGDYIRAGLVNLHWESVLSQDGNTLFLDPNTCLGARLRVCDGSWHVGSVAAWLTAEDRERPVATWHSLGCSLSSEKSLELDNSPEHCRGDELQRLDLIVETSTDTCSVSAWIASCVGLEGSPNPNQFLLVVTRQKGEVVLSRPFSRGTGMTMDRGTVARFEFDLPPSITAEDIAHEGAIQIQPISSDYPWCPRHVFLVGVTKNGTQRLLGGKPYLKGIWLSTDSLNGHSRSLTVQFWK